MTPDGQTGPQYSDLSRIAMEDASTAEEAVTILGEMIDEHGYTTYGGNSHLFADENEGWVFVEFAGGAGLGEEFTVDNYFCCGDTFQDITGVLDYRFDEWKIQ